MLKFTVLTVIAAISTSCEASDDPLKSLDLNRLLQSLQQKIEQSQDKVLLSQGTQDDVQEDQYGGLTDKKVRELLQETLNKNTYETNNQHSDRKKDQNILEVRNLQLDDDLQDYIKSSLFGEPNRSPNKKKRRYPTKAYERKVRASEYDKHQRKIHQILNNEDDIIRNEKKRSREDDRGLVNEELSHHVLERLLKHERSKKKSTDNDLAKLLKGPTRFAREYDSRSSHEVKSEEKRDDDELDLNLKDYSKVYVVLNSEALKSARNKNKLNSLLSKLLDSPPRSHSHKDHERKTYKGFYINDDVDDLERRRGGGGFREGPGMGESLGGGGGDEGYSQPKRPLRSQNQGGGRGGGGSRGGPGGGRGAGRMRDEGGRAGGGGGFGAGGGGGFGAGGGGGGYRGAGGGSGPPRGGHTAIPYMKHRGDVYERGP